MYFLVVLQLNVLSYYILARKSVVKITCLLTNRLICAWHLNDVDKQVLTGAHRLPHTMKAHEAVKFSNFFLFCLVFKIKITQLFRDNLQQELQKIVAQAISIHRFC